MLKLIKSTTPLVNSLKLKNFSQIRQFSFQLNQIQFDKVKKDNEYPSLYYYPTKDSQIILSLLNPNQIQTKSKNLSLGFIGATSQELNGLKANTLDPSKFDENTKFTDFLHECLAKSSIDNDQNLLALAQYQKEGWLHVADQRNPAPWGRIPLPEDIFGSLLVQDGKIINNSYQRMPSHRIISSAGLFWLSDELFNDLVAQLKLKLNE